MFMDVIDKSNRVTGGRWCAQNSSQKLIPKSITKREYVVFHDKLKSLHESRTSVKEEMFHWRY